MQPLDGLTQVLIFSFLADPDGDIPIFAVLDYLLGRTSPRNSVGPALCSFCRPEKFCRLEITYWHLVHCCNINRLQRSARASFRRRRLRSTLSRRQRAAQRRAREELMSAWRIRNTELARLENAAGESLARHSACMSDASKRLNVPLQIMRFQFGIAGFDKFHDVATTNRSHELFTPQYFCGEKHPPGVKFGSGCWNSEQLPLLFQLRLPAPVRIALVAS